MPNPIKYSTGSETLALKKGNFYIGTGDVGKGPTNVTGYYNGITPPTGGYTIYLNKETGGPSIYTASNDAQLISLTNSIAGTSYTTANECLVYFAGQTDKVVLNRDYEGIVTDGLVLNLDAGFTPSYPRSGTTWSDINGLGPKNNGTLINGPTFSGDSIVFDGTNDFIKVTHNGSLDFNSSDFTTVNWCRIDGGSGTFRALFQNSVGETLTRQFGLVGATNNKWGVWMTINNIWGARLFSSSGIIIGAWTMVTVTYKNNSNLNIYVNGVLDATTPISGNLTYNPTVMNIGKRYPDAEFFNGPIATGLIYNRAISASEVLQNFNAQKSRFGL